MSTHRQKAQELFREGYNCAQSVFAAFCDVTGMEFEEALKLSSSFGGGMGKLREVCGALTGIFMVAGVRYGYTDPGDDQAKAEHYQRIQAFAQRFKEENTSILCRELLALGEGPDSPIPQKRTEDYYKSRPCEHLVGFAACILDEYMQDQETANGQTEQNSLSTEG